MDPNIVIIERATGICPQVIEEQLVTLASEVAHLRKLNKDLDAENDQLRARNLYLESPDDDSNDDDDVPGETLLELHVTYGTFKQGEAVPELMLPGGTKRVVIEYDDGSKELMTKSFLYAVNDDVIPLLCLGLNKMRVEAALNPEFKALRYKIEQRHNPENGSSKFPWIYIELHSKEATSWTARSRNVEGSNQWIYTKRFLQFQDAKQQYHEKCQFETVLFDSNLGFDYEWCRFEPIGGGDVTDITISPQLSINWKNRQCAHGEQKYAAENAKLLTELEEARGALKEAAKRLAELGEFEMLREAGKATQRKSPQQLHNHHHYHQYCSFDDSAVAAASGAASDLPLP